MPIGATTMSAISIGVCHFTTANRRVYQQTIADLPFNDDHRQTAKPTVCRPLTLSDVTSHVA